MINIVLDTNVFNTHHTLKCETCHASVLLAGIQRLCDRIIEIVPVWVISFNEL